MDKVNIKVENNFFFCLIYDMFGEISLLLLFLVVIFFMEDNWDLRKEVVNDFLVYSLIILKNWCLLIF